MSPAPNLESASGLRLTAAFLLIAAVLGLVALKACKITLFDAGEQPHCLTRATAPEIAFDLVGQDGTPLALSVQRMDLVAYPNALWQAHTPESVIRKLSAALGGEFGTPRLVSLLFPDMDPRGWIELDRAPFQSLNQVQASEVQKWLARGSTEERDDANPLAGFELFKTRVPGEWRLRWQPLLVLSQGMREQHKAQNPVLWSRRIADDLITCVFGREARKELDNERELAAARRVVWDALLPTQFKCLAKELAPEVTPRVWSVLKSENVRNYQMDLVALNKRVYPVREMPVREGPREEPPFAVLGAWGMLDSKDARERARQDLHLADDAVLNEEERANLQARTALRTAYPSPTSGLEYYAHNLLRGPAWSWIARQPEQYYFLASYVPRRPPQRYFEDLVPGSPTPRVITTIDPGLQRHMHMVLEQVLETHRPALAMAIAIDVASGRVLAVDSVNPYDMSGFLPTMHTYTPGSTMKAIVMATAIDTGHVDLNEQIDTFDGHFVIGKRAIHEAEGAQHGWLTPAEGLAYSCNAVLVQIGTRIPAQVLFQRFKQLGYSSFPVSGLGGERRGLIPNLPWSISDQHASVCFGHQMSVTLWQHTAALATIVRGGEFKPLRLVDAVEQGDQKHELPPPAPGAQVFKPETCKLVRDMMQMGARIGTGKGVYCPDLVMGTKTGTAEKVPGELCLHVELAANQQQKPGAPRPTRAQLKSLPKPHRGSCYTSSMCAWGSLHEGEREILVYVVVDEPRGARHYGSEIAGPACMSILKEALGYTNGGVRRAESPAPGFVLADVPEGHGSTAHQDELGQWVDGLPEQPWREGQHAAR